MKKKRILTFCSQSKLIQSFLFKPIKIIHNPVQYLVKILKQPMRVFSCHKLTKMQYQRWSTNVTVFVTIISQQKAINHEQYHQTKRVYMPGNWYNNGFLSKETRHKASKNCVSDYLIQFLFGDNPNVFNSEIKTTKIIGDKSCLQSTK